MSLSFPQDTQIWAWTSVMPLPGSLWVGCSVLDPGHGQAHNKYHTNICRVSAFPQPVALSHSESGSDAWLCQCSSTAIGTGRRVTPPFKQDSRCFLPVLPESCHAPHPPPSILQGRVPWETGHLEMGTTGRQACIRTSPVVLAMAHVPGTPGTHGAISECGRGFPW